MLALAEMLTICQLKCHLPLTINISESLTECKKYIEKRLLKMFFDRWWRLDGVKTLIKISVRDLCWLLQQGCMGIVWTTTRTRVSDATAVIKCFNPSKLYPLSGKIFRKWFASYFLFIHEHLVKFAISNGKSYCCITTLLLKSGFHRC